MVVTIMLLLQMLSSNKVLSQKNVSVAVIGAMCMNLASVHAANGRFDECTLDNDARKLGWTCCWR